jgi:hypothetical protein
MFVKSALLVKLDTPPETDKRIEDAPAAVLVLTSVLPMYMLTMPLNSEAVYIVPAV